MNKIHRVLEVNCSSSGSTGKIMLDIARICNSIENEIEVYTSCANNRDVSKDINYKIGLRHERLLHKITAKYTGLSDVYSSLGTYLLTRQINRIKPEIIHFHNLHSWYLNLPMLFKYINSKNIAVIITLHDCWTFTGHCPYFDYIGCDKWKKGCNNCPQLKNYPESLIDRTDKMWVMKKKLFSDMNRLILVTPSLWLSRIVEESFLSCMDTRVINNGIDLSIFRPRNSDYRNKNGLTPKLIVLGVAHDWEPRKGLDIFINLAKRLDDRFQIILVGTNKRIDSILPKQIMSVNRTNNQVELAEIYSSADVFVNPTWEDNFPTVNIEALATGTPVLTFDTGGSSEIIDDTCGSVVPKGDIDKLESEIKRICLSKAYTKEACVNRAARYSSSDNYKRYIDIYSSIIGVRR